MNVGRKKWQTGLLHAAILTTSVLMVMPVVWAIFTSFKVEADIISATPQLLPNTWTLDNYRMLSTKAPFLRFFMNSIFICSVSTVTIMIGCPLVGYILAKYNFRGKNIIFLLIMATILIPQQAYIVPLYMMVRRFGWIDTYIGLIWPRIIMSTGIFFLRQNIISIPDDLIHAARIDGCSELRVFWKIIFPLSFSATAAVCIINWVGTWNEFLWYLVVASSERLFTTALGLMYFQRQFMTQYGGIMAACVITILPVLIFFLIFRTRIMKGVSSSGLKY